jgi:hypothetical protein
MTTRRQAITTKTLLLALACFCGCADVPEMTARLDRLPGGGPGAANAPVNQEKLHGVVSYLASDDPALAAARRQDAYKLMADACAGKYKLAAEVLINDGAETVYTGNVAATTTLIKRDSLSFDCLSAALSTGSAQVLWKNGALGDLEGGALKLSTDPLGKFSAASQPIADQVSGDATSLEISATEACPNGCNGDVMHLSLSPASYVGKDFSDGHLQMDIQLAQPLDGKILLWYGNGKACNSYAVDAHTLSTRAFTHLSIPFASFNSHCAHDDYVSVPLRIVFSKMQFQAGPVLELGDVEWSPN